MADYSENEPGFVKRHGLKIVGAVVGLCLIFGLVKLVTGGKSNPRPSGPTMVMVDLPPPPPRPTPPPKPTPPPEPQEQPEPKPEDMIMQDPVQADEPPAPEAPPDEPPAGLGTNITGDGPGDSFGLGGAGNGRIGGTGTGSGSGGGGGKWGAYAAQVQTQIATALRNDSETRTSELSLKVRVWPDSTGRITRAELSSSSGDAATDRAIERVLTSLRLSEPPPADMPSPINMRITARRPGGA